MQPLTTPVKPEFPTEETLGVRLATIDELTGLLSRRAFLEQSDALLKLCQRQNQNATFVMPDLDKFKAINDQHGHGGGDLVLREFAIFMPGTSLEAALTLLEKLRSMAENHITHYHGDTIRTSVSMGVSDTRADSIASISSLSRVSDEALYRAKSAGGNKVVPAITSL